MYTLLYPVRGFSFEGSLEDEIDDEEKGVAKMGDPVLLLSGPRRDRDHSRAESDRETYGRSVHYYIHLHGTTTRRLHAVVVVVLY